MIYRVEITTNLGDKLQVAHHFEQIVDNTEEAESFGENCAQLMAAYNNGFGGADLGDDDG